MAFCSVLSLQVYDACGGREGIYSLAFCCVLLSLQVYDAGGGEGGDIQLDFLLCLVIIASVRCMWGRGRGYRAWLSAVSYHCKCMMHVGEREGIYSLAF